MMMEAVTATLRHRRREGWLVGGTVRDWESGRLSPDLDLVVADGPSAVAREIAARLSSPWFALSARHGTYRVVAEEGHIDVAGMRGSSILDDLAGRDFTINAMAVPADGGEIVDPFGGRTHLREKRLVAVSNGIFVDDPLRLMRAVRFCHNLGLRMDQSLEGLLRSQVSELVRAAPERIAMEMTLTLSGTASAEVIRLWDRLGLVPFILPEMASSWRDGSLSAEAQSSLERLDHVLSHLSSWFPQCGEVVLQRLEKPVDGAWTRTVALRLAAVTRCLSPEQASSMARRLRFSTAMFSLLRSVSTCFRGGRCGPEGLEEAARSPRATVQFLWDAAPWEPEMILLAISASSFTTQHSSTPHDGRAPHSRCAPHEEHAGDALQGAGILEPARGLMVSWARRTTGAIPRLPLDGKTLMQELDLIPGPLLGQILREVRLAWEAEEVATAGEALGLAKTLVEGR